MSKNKCVYVVIVSVNQIISCILGSNDSNPNVLYQKTDRKLEMGVKILNLIMVRLAGPLYVLCPILLTVLENKYSDRSTESYIQIMPAT